MPYFVARNKKLVTLAIKPCCTEEVACYDVYAIVSIVLVECGTNKFEILIGCGLTGISTFNQ